jgi:hypothetical protein
MGSACSLHTSAICPRDLSLLIEPDNPLLTVSRQAELLGLPRRSYYYDPVDNTKAQILLKRDMDAIDAIYTDYPFYGSRRMQLELVDRYGIDIGRDRIRRVMQLLGLEAIYPKPNTSKPDIGAGHTVYPYLTPTRSKHPTVTPLEPVYLVSLAVIGMRLVLLAD